METSEERYTYLFVMFSLSYDKLDIIYFYLHFILNIHPDGTECSSEYRFVQS